MTRPAAYSFLRYLAAKESVDARALNRGVRDALGQALAARSPQTRLRVLEIGCGLGAMAARLVEWGFLRDAVYAGIDLEPACISEARRRFNLPAGPHLDLSLTFEAGDFFAFATQAAGKNAWDLILAHAFLDLVDLDDTLPQIFRLLKPGGWFYFTLNFDGGSIFQPAMDPMLDARIETLYHRSMARRSAAGKLSDGSTTGRRLFAALPAAGATVLAAGASDWVVFPQGGGYQEDEAYFLHFILHTVAKALAGHPELDRRSFQAWLEDRHTQVEAGKLVYLAHQLDFFGRVP